MTTLMRVVSIVLLIWVGYRLVLSEEESSERKRKVKVWVSRNTHGWSAMP